MRHNKEVWILEDDPGCVFVYQEILTFRYHLRFFESLKEVQLALQEAHPHLMIADLLVKDGHFFDLLSSSNTRHLLQIPFIVVSSLDDLDALRFCFEEGAIDYLIKPFKKNELIVKVERAISHASLEFIPSSHKATLLPLPSHQLQTEEDLSELTRKEVSIFNLFLRAKDMTLVRDEILSKVWCTTHVHPKTLDVHLYNLRKKLQKLGFNIICTGRGQWILSRMAENPHAIG